MAIISWTKRDIDNQAGALESTLSQNFMNFGPQTA